MARVSGELIQRGRMSLKEGENWRSSTLSTAAGTLIDAESGGGDLGAASSTDGINSSTELLVFRRKTTTSSRAVSGRLLGCASPTG
jgi:hypothetical protein